MSGDDKDDGFSGDDGHDRANGLIGSAINGTVLGVEHFGNDASAAKILGRALGPIAAFTELTEVAAKVIEGDVDGAIVQGGGAFGSVIGGAVGVGAGALSAGALTGGNPVAAVGGGVVAGYYGGAKGEKIAEQWTREMIDWFSGTGTPTNSALDSRSYRDTYGLHEIGYHMSQPDYAPQMGMGQFDSPNPADSNGGYGLADDPISRPGVNNSSNPADLIENYYDGLDPGTSPVSNAEASSPVSSPSGSGASGGAYERNGESISRPGVNNSSNPADLMHNYYGSYPSGGNDDGGGHSGYGGSDDLGDEGMDGGPGDAVPPIILDLNGDGVSLRSLQDSTAFFDVNGDGFRNNLAWVDEGDGILVYDKDGDGLVRDVDEISFVSYLPGAQTDLEGLAAFDTNGDQKLDAGDADWAQFGVWVDRDQNGVSDEGEFKSLEHKGISAIELSSDHNEQHYDDGSTVYGTGSFYRANGSRGEFVDAALAYSSAGIRRDDDGSVTFRGGSGELFGGHASEVGQSVDIAAAGLLGYLGGAGDDTLDGSGALGSILDGGGGDDELKGGDGDDWLAGGTGSDILFGGAGHDVLVIDDDDLKHGAVMGGSGFDIAFVAGERGVTVSLEAIEIEAMFGGIHADHLQAGAQSGVLLSGGAGNDVLEGGAGADVLIGGAGVDRFVAGAGDDLISIDGDDFSGEDFSGGLDGGDGVDVVVVSGTSGASVMLKGTNVEVLIGNTGDDVLSAEGTQEGVVLDGGAGDDALTGGSGADLLVGGAGSDSLVGGDGHDTALFDGSISDFGFGYAAGGLEVRSLGDAAGDGEADVLWGIEQVGFADAVVALDGVVVTDGAGTEADELLFGTDVADVLMAGAGNNLLAGGGGDDVLESLSGNDVLDGGSGNDQLSGGGGDDVVMGGQGDDHVRGRAGNDYLLGGDGDDFLAAHAGDDVVWGGKGHDTVWGGAGNDTFVYARGDGQDDFGIWGSDWATAHDVLRLDDIDHDELWFSEDGDDDLIIDVLGSAGDQLQLWAWFTGPWSTVHEIRSADGYALDHTDVQQLVDAMAAFEPAGVAGDAALADAAVAALSPTLAAVWKPVEVPGG